MNTAFKCEILEPPSHLGRKSEWIPKNLVGMWGWPQKTFRWVQDLKAMGKLCLTASIPQREQDETEWCGKLMWKNENNDHLGRKIMESQFRVINPISAAVIFLVCVCVSVSVCLCAYVSCLCVYVSVSVCVLSRAWHKSWGREEPGKSLLVFIPHCHPAVEIEINLGVCPYISSLCSDQEIVCGSG